MIYLDKIVCKECVMFMKELPDNFIDLTMTSPPYDNLRDYNGFMVDCENIIKELYRITKHGGVIVWVVGDAIRKGNTLYWLRHICRIC
ncbi:MAG: site-specific DNA-methyltransferase [Rickettsiales bacterium]|jgi:site-specific DNA-methyltransferase (adenine-specific)|nr:site-specific DNA-methyltransferase [Rickettsiales bacterium]